MGMIKTATEATGWAILFRLLIVSIILVLIIIIVTLVVDPTMTASSYLLRTPATASSSVGIWLISLEIGFAVAAILITVTLICASLKPIVLKLALIVLRSLASASLCEASELLATALTVKRYAALILTWGSIIIIMIIVIRVIVSVCLVCLLVFWWVLSVTLRFSFRFTSTSGLLQFCPLEWWGYFFYQ